MNNVMSRWNWYDFQGNAGYVQPTQNDELYAVGDQSPGDHTYLPGPITATPGTMEYYSLVYMGAPVNQPMHANASFTIPIGSLPSIRGVHLVSNYTATVSTSDNQRIGTLDLQTGSIGQLQSADGTNDLVITTYLGVLGGTLNNTSYLGTVHITGASGYTTPAPASANIFVQTAPITIGSTISVEGLGTETTGAAMTVWGGNYKFVDDAGVTVEAHCRLQLGGIPSSIPVADRPNFQEEVVVTKIGNDQKVTVFSLKKDSTAEVRDDFKGKIAVVVQGKLYVEHGVKFEIESPDAVTISIKIGATGVMILTGGSETETNKGVECDGSVAVLGYTQGQITEKAAVLKGSLQINKSGMINLGTAEAGVYPTLDCRSSVFISGLLYTAVNVSTNSSGDCGYLQSSETISFDEDSKVRLIPRNAAGQGVQVGGAIGQFWLPARALISISMQLPTPLNANVNVSAIEEQEILKVTLTAPFDFRPI